MRPRRFIIMAAFMTTAALILCGVFGVALRLFWEPMDDQVYDLSLTWWETEALPEDWTYDQKGWKVFVQEGETPRELEPNGYGMFSGLDYPEQTIYLSRVMVEELDGPTLRLDPGERTFSVFLDGTLIYTDCPELDNRIGYLRLPCLDYYREEPLLVNLPPDFKGKTLTIAQSTTIMDTDSLSALPAVMVLYCGYTYESGLISESFRTAVPSALAFAAGTALLVLFLWRAARGKLYPTPLCGAMAAFLYGTSRMFSPSFFFHYFGTVSVIDVPTLCENLALLNLLGLLLCKLSGRRRVPLWAVLGGIGAATLAELIADPMGRFGIFTTLQYTVIGLLGLIGLLAALACGFWEWKRGNRFFLIFCPLAAAGTIIVCLTSIFKTEELWSHIIGQISLGLFSWFLLPLIPVFLVPAFLGAAVELVQEELSARAETRLVARQTQMARQSYEAMRRQHREVMLLRHDMMKHYGVLRQMTGEPQVAGYLDELIGENEKIRPVVQSGNEMLDIILNSKLTEAASHDIAAEVVRTKAPETLPLSDAELCSLIMNLMDNAIEAASAPEVERRYIRLDLHIKNNFFVFTCENAATPEWVKKEKAPGRGLGLRIVHRVTERYGDLINTEYGQNYYRVNVLLPIHSPLR